MAEPEERKIKRYRRMKEEGSMAETRRSTIRSERRGPRRHSEERMKIISGTKQRAENTGFGGCPQTTTHDQCAMLCEIAGD